MPRFGATASIKAEPHWTSSPAGSTWSPVAGCSLGAICPCLPSGQSSPCEGAGVASAWFPVPMAELDLLPHGPWSCLPCELLNWKLEKKHNKLILKKKPTQKQHKEKDLHSPVPSNITIKHNNFVYFYSTDTCWIFIIVMSLVPFCLFINSSIPVIWAFIALNWNK